MYGPTIRSQSGESGNVPSETAESWKERLPEIMEEYKKEDTLNLDETGFFFVGTA